jgi:hypothetical protein
MIRKKDSFLPIAAFVMISWIYFSYGIHVHTWESYFYAGSIDNFIPVSDMAPPGLKLSLPYNDLICIYYTQHPLLYVGVYWIHKRLPHINPLNIVQTINLMLGMIGLWGVYLILKKLFDTIIACEGLLLISFLDVYWYQTLSGEVYIGAFSFLSLSFYCLINVINCNDQPKKFVHMCICFGIAVWFHLYASIFGLIILFDILKWHKPLPLRLRYLLVFGMLSFIFFISAYVLPYFLLTSICSLYELSQLLFIHSNIWGIWQIPDHLMPVEIIYSLFTGYRHMLHAIISGNGLVSHVFRLFIGACIGIFVMRYLIKRNKNRILNICLLCFGSYFLMLTILIHVPQVNDNWCLCLFSLILFIMYGYQSFLITHKGKLLMGVMIIVVFLINGTNDIFPKNRLINHHFFLAEGVNDQIAQYEKIVFMGNHNILSQAWHIFYQNDNKRPQMNYIHPPYEYPQIVQYQQDLLNYIRRSLTNNDKILMISAENDRWLRLTVHLIKSFGYSIQPVFQKTLTIDPKTYKVALGIIKKSFELKYVAYQISIR